ncbi:hypothetical protein [Candidatus Laterigemmans baculatus]|uniref:hypothetical protein n=1 Tax=Candidatus Laterigemmans baculatus TaxID=2770505 RepID=UPI001F41B02A|nr:hypothetical protein [Candidatus Laterigemmans baculatus]
MSDEPRLDPSLDLSHERSAAGTFSNRPRSDRRGFLRTAATSSALLGAGELGFLPRLRPVSAAESKLPADAVQFHADIEPLVRLLEETPREKVIEAFAAEIQSGTSYQRILAALLLAGVRNIQPRPSVGFKFHAVLVVNSAHLASVASPDSDRWLPIFWALDYFKSAQATDVREGDWTLAAVDESKVPPTHRARQAFIDAMENWDVEAADVAVAGLTRTHGANELFELFAHYGSRDFRSIGHKAIFVSNSFRTLHSIGWRYAEPVLRSLAYALLNHHGEPNPAQSDLGPDRAWRRTDRFVTEMTPEWIGGRSDPAATADLLAALRTASPEEAVELTAKMLAQGISTESIYDALFLSSGETLMQQPGIVALHSVTSTNAMHYAFQTAKKAETRQRVLLQNAAFIPYFREAMRGRGQVRDLRIDAEGETRSDGAPNEAGPSVETIFQTVSENRGKAAEQMLAYLNQGGQAEEVLQAARRLVFLKGTGSHDYKFSSAVLEDYRAVSPKFRNQYLASAAYLLPGAGDRDNALIARTRAALEA